MSAHMLVDNIYNLRVSTQVVPTADLSPECWAPLCWCWMTGNKLIFVNAASVHAEASPGNINLLKIITKEVKIMKLQVLNGAQTVSVLGIGETDNKI